MVRPNVVLLDPLTTDNHCLIGGTLKDGQEKLVNHQYLGLTLADFAQIWYIGALSVNKGRKMVKICFQSNPKKADNVHIVNRSNSAMDRSIVLRYVEALMVHTSCGFVEYVRWCIN